MGQNIDHVEHERARMEAILKSIANGLIVCDPQNYIILINKAACDMLGWSVQDALGKPLTEIAPISYLKPEEQIPSVMTSLNAHTAEFYLLRKNGTKLPAELTTSSIILDDNVIGSVVLFRDISAELDANRAKSDFVAISSHQLRTPLGSIKWNLEMLLEDEFGPIPDTAKETMTQVLKSVQRMIDLVNDLLDVSRIDLGANPGPTEEINIQEAVTEVIEETKHDVQKKSLTVEFNADPAKTISLSLDKKKFHEVLANLLNNAIKYSQLQGKIVIKIDNFADKIQLGFSDNGIGIPAADQTRVFTKFFRSNNAIKSSPEGTGLGLYVVKSYIEKWGGKIWFNSGLNKGTTFYLEMPKK